MELVLSVVSLALGSFVAIWPRHAAGIWGWKNLETLPPPRRIAYFSCYRALGILLCLAGLLIATNALT